MQLRLNIGSYCALLWSIFGKQCDYYHELLKVYRILDRKECFTIQDAYTREICAQITLAIIDNGCSFFGCNPVASDFMPGARVDFSASLLESITDVVRNALLIQRATFPREWITPTPTPMGQTGGGGFQSPSNPWGPHQRTGQVHPPQLHLALQGAHPRHQEEGQGSKEVKTSATQRSRPSWTHTSRRTIITLNYWLF